MCFLGREREKDIDRIGNGLDEHKSRSDKKIREYR